MLEEHCIRGSLRLREEKKQESRKQLKAISPSIYFRRRLEAMAGLVGQAFRGQPSIRSHLICALCELRETCKSVWRLKRILNLFA